MINPKLFIVVGASGAGKGVLLRALRDMGSRQVAIIPKATTREKKTTDGDEMVSYFGKSIPDIYDILYGNYKNTYGIQTNIIWETLTNNKHALLICSNFITIDENGEKIPGTVDAIPELYRRFGPLVKLIYLYSPISTEETEKHHFRINTQDKEEVKKRGDGIDIVRQYYVDNIAKFDHVLLNIREPEDLSDQMFRVIMLYS